MALHGPNAISSNFRLFSTSPHRFPRLHFFLLPVTKYLVMHKIASFHTVSFEYFLYCQIISIVMQVLLEWTTSLDVHVTSNVELRNYVPLFGVTQSNVDLRNYVPLFSVTQSNVDLRNYVISSQIVI